MKRRMAMFGVLSAMAMAVSACSSTPTATPVPPTATPLPKSFVVAVGGQEVSQSLQIEAFLPNDITLNVGDSIAFQHKVAEGHTVTFNPPATRPADFTPRADGKLEVNGAIFFPSQGAPPAPGAAMNLAFNFDGGSLLNTGIMGGPADIAKVTFTKAGAYNYICYLHPEMKGSVKVNAAGTAYPRDSAADSKAATDSLVAHIAAGKKLMDGIKVAEPQVTLAGTVYSVYAGAGSVPDRVDYMRFIGGENLSIRVGDKVNFSLAKNPAGTPHTITLLSGGKAPDPFVPEAGTPPKLIVNPEVLGPSPASPQPYRGTGYYNSGLLVTGAPTSAQEYTLSFITAGVYKYICLLHDPAGMNGTITVS